MKLKDILKEIEISRGITIDVQENQIIVNGSPLKRLDIAYRGMSDRVYRGYLFTDKGQINLSGGRSGLNEFYEATGKPNNIYPKDYYAQYGVDVTFSEFDVS